MVRRVMVVAAEGEHRGLFGMVCHGGVLVVVCGGMAVGGGYWQWCGGVRW